MSPTPTPTSWAPPTPDSILVRLPSPPAPLGAFDPLPPPLATHDTFPSTSTQRLSVANLLNDPMEHYHRATPTSFAEREPPVQGFFLAQSHEPRAAVILPPSFLQPPSAPSSHPLPSSQPLSSPHPNSTRKRPPRAAAKPLPPRQPSPFSLSPPPASRPSNRKVSHSLIERRRREKINECLGKLKGMVPQCREEGERKEERARERGRKRGRAEEAGGGLHKLEILQGTILYIEELEARLMAFETPLSPSPLASSASPISSTSSLLHPILPKWTGADEVGLPTDTDSAALLLLKFSTSPELRPVFFAD